MKNVWVTISGTSHRLLARQRVKGPEGWKSGLDAFRFCRGWLLWLWEVLPDMLAIMPKLITRAGARASCACIISISFVAQDQHQSTVI